MEGEESILRFFTYNPHIQHTYEKRKESLNNRNYPRNELAEHLLAYNAYFDADHHTKTNIERLKEAKTQVVIGGQQAGLLTGPIYSISKIISIIKLASEQEEKLGVPVIPVFWIAGEDHDYQEINHVYSPLGEKMEKYAFSLKGSGKKMVSELEFNKEELKEWAKEVVKSFGETAHTVNIISSLEDALIKSQSITDFFAHIITELFKGTGLVLVNASDKNLRKIETKFFLELLEKNKEITKGVLHSQENLENLGYAPLLEVSEDSMNLFYHRNGERELLYWNEKEAYATTKDSGLKLTLEELKKKMEEAPAHFSNNVVTRPLMQEFLFPTLAFIGGPGEISYWAELKDSFEAVNLEMPPVVPRISLTFLERHVEASLKNLEESLTDVLENGLESKKKAWLYQTELHQLEEKLAHYQKEYQEVHMKFKDLGNDMMPHLEPAFDKNWRLIDRQFSYLQRLMERSAYEKHENIMKKYEKVELALRPQGMPQERVWNIFYFLNTYGTDLIHRVCQLPLHHNGKHKVIKL